MNAAQSICAVICWYSTHYLATDAGQLLRQERTYTYKQMQTVQVPDDINAYAQQQYREQTAYMRVIEAILIDRPGYRPDE